MMVSIFYDTFAVNVCVWIWFSIKSGFPSNDIRSAREIAGDSVHKHEFYCSLARLPVAAALYDLLLRGFFCLPPGESEISHKDIRFSKDCEDLTVWPLGSSEWR